MAKKLTTRGAQYPLVAEFVWNFDDTMVDTAGVIKDFASTGGAVVNAIHLPVGAVVTGGDVTAEVGATGSTAYNVSVGYAGAATELLNAANRVTAGRSALTPSGRVGDGEDIILTVAPTVANATAGRFTLRVEYVIRDRVNEVQTH